MSATDDVRAKLESLARLRRDGGMLRDYRAPRWDEPFIMEQGSPGERGVLVPLAEEGVTAEVGAAADYIPEGMARAAAPALPEMAQHQVLRHYLRYSQMTLGMDLGSDISEGTCTMKYSPKMHEELIRGHKAADLHPWQDEDTLQGILQIVYETGQYLKSVSGMDAFTLQPGGGSHAVFTNAVVMRRYFEAKGELDQRNEMITTIFSHPCDAATPAVAGFKVITVMPDENGYPDLEAFKAAVSEKTIGCMITNPEDTGIYNPQIDRYVEVLHDAGALAFTDQANANGILGYARARDAGFDACHFNLHKTFSSPHGCEGPATGAYMVTDELAPYLPVPVVTKVGDRYHLDYDRPESVGRVRGFLGNWMGVIRAYAWIRNLGPRGLKEVAEVSVLNNNYLDRLLMGVKGVSRPYAEGHRRLDQVRYSLERLKEDTGVGTEAVRDRMVDFGIQSYWMSHHPWVVPEPFTPEPCETYSKADLDEWAAVIKRASDEAYENAQFVMDSPHAQPIDQMRRTEAMEDPDQWAFTWRKYKRRPAPPCMMAGVRDERCSVNRSSRPGLRMAQSFGLTLLLVTAVFLASLALTRLAKGALDWHAAAAVVSTLAGAAACLAMLVDAVDLWMLGRRLSASMLRLNHSFVFVAVLVAFALTFAGQNVSLFVLLMPSLLVYLIVVRSKPPAAGRAAARGGRGNGAGYAGPARQRRGGRKRR